MDDSQKEHGSTGQPADDQHDPVKSPLGFSIEMSVYDVRRDMPLLSQKPGGPEENNPEQGIFGHRYNPYRGLSEQESHADGIADSGRDQYEDDPGQCGHDV